MVRILSPGGSLLLFSGAVALDASVGKDIVGAAGSIIILGSVCVFGVGKWGCSCIKVRFWCVTYLEPILITRSIAAGCKGRCLRCRFKIVLNVALATPVAILPLPPWPRTFRSAL